MEIIRGNKVKFKSPKDIYLVTVETIELGEVHDYHTIKLPCENNEDGLNKLREIIISLECCSKQYPNGKPVEKDYNGLPFYNERLLGNWYNKDGYQDQLLSYKVRYYDEDGVLWKINITNDEEMIDIITNCEIRE